MAKKINEEKNACCDDGCCGGRRSAGNPFVGIAGSLGGLLVAIVAIVAIFAETYLEITVPIAFSFALLGIFLGYFAYKQNR
jgi:hypothetical protein